MNRPLAHVVQRRMGRKSCRAFSLIELLVALAIIAIIIGLIIGGYQAVQDSASRNETKARITELESILNEYMTLTGEPTPYDNRPDMMTKHFIDEVRKIDKTRVMLEKLGENVAVVSSRVSVLDAYGRPIRMGGVNDRRDRWFWSVGPNGTDDSNIDSPPEQRPGLPVGGDDIGGNIVGIR